LRVTAADDETNTKPAKDPQPFRGTFTRLRREAGDAIERLIALLDDIEGDSDLEDEP
jgi:hypothetical protein